MDEQQFRRFGEQGYTHVPVMRKAMADFDTPLSIYWKLAAEPYSYLLESAAQGGERWNRYSIIGLPSDTIIRARGTTITLELNGRVEQSIQSDDPFEFIRSYQARFRVPTLEDAPRFLGGLVGYFGYDAVRYVEQRIGPTPPPDSIGCPDILLMLSKDVVVFDNVSSHIQLITLADVQREDAWEQSQKRLQDLQDQLLRSSSPPRASDTSQSFAESDFTSEYGRENFIRDIEKIREYVVAGDVMQVVLSQRLSAPFSAPPLSLYRALRSMNPSPYMYFMNLDEFHIVASTPEILARVEGRTVISRPLAGTRPRGESLEEDSALEKELLSDPKELSEHLMLIDLGRNDVGRVSKYGSVKVTEKFVVERYSHVMHISSNVEGELRDDQSAIDVLQATLPVGTLSGAPKIRAMEIIDELEPVKRGIYGGAVGYLAWNGNMDMAIAIRTAIVKDGNLWIQAGCGIVADSDPDMEWQESMNKARAVFLAARLASGEFADVA